MSSPPRSVVGAELLPSLVAEAAKKSRVCWLSWAGGPPRLVWHVWYDDALVVLSGDDGQALTGLGGSGTVEVTMRSKDTGGRLVAWSGSVGVVTPEDVAWEPCATALLGVRLNLVDPAATLAAWRSAGTIVRIVPSVATGSPSG